MIRRRATSTLSPELYHYVVTGCYAGANLYTFLLAGHVLRGNFSGLRQLWAAVEVEVRRLHPSLTFAEKVLRLDDGDMFAVPPTTCREHQRCKEGRE